MTTGKQFYKLCVMIAFLIFGNFMTSKARYVLKIILLTDQIPVWSNVHRVPTKGVFRWPHSIALVMLAGKNNIPGTNMRLSESIHWSIIYYIIGNIHKKSKKSWFREKSKCAYLRQLVYSIKVIPFLCFRFRLKCRICGTPSK